MKPTRSTLDYALLGLLARKPASGYDLRRIFQDTLLGSYSDSPGSIYPALRRLEAAKLIQGRGGNTGRRRRLFALTPRGRAALARWLAEPVSVDQLARDAGAFELRLAFLSDVLPAHDLARTLRDHAGALDTQHEQVAEVHRSIGGQLSPSAHLALELGMSMIRARATWCRQAARRWRSSAS
jgi:DNA-binding PadR family transcriptional regulator